MSACAKKKCRRVVTQAFDVYNPWWAKYAGVGNPTDDTPKRHYEVCDKHASEFWPRGEGYLERELAERILRKLVAS